MLSIVLNKIFNKLISFLEIDTLILDLRESSCNMTRGGEMKILRGGSENF